MGFIKEFKEFALKSNMLDLAIAFIIGVEFNKIVTSFVKDIIMPPIGLLLGGMDITARKFILKTGPTAAETVTLNYGVFMQTVLNFIIVAFAVFLMVKAINTLRRRQAAAPEKEGEPLTKDQALLTEIRDSLLRQKV